jgi:hypothetical protein
MLPEVRVLLERARTRRHAILGLLDVAPEAFWLRTAPGDGWSARAHTAHLAAIDGPLATLARRAAAGAPEAWLFDVSDPLELESARASAMAAMADGSPRQLREALEAARLPIAAALEPLRPASLEMRVMVAGDVDSWGRQLSWSLRDYLGHWAEHDALHEAAIRAAFTTPPDLSAVAITRRLR